MGQYHPGLVEFIRRHLGAPRARDNDTVREIAQRVWWLVAPQGGNRLSAFDPKRGPFEVYLNVLAWDQIHGYLRSECRLHRLEREFARARRRSAGGTPEEVEALLAEIRPLLSAKLRLILDYRLGIIPSAALGMSPAGIRQSTCRLRMALKKLLE
jgi:hypothetical protein